MARMKVRITDKRVLRQVNVYLKAGAMIKGVVVKSEEGAPQGSPLSPLLSNIVLSKSERTAQRVMESTSRFIERRMRLKVNEKKSAIGRAGGV